MLFIPANSSASGFFELLYENEGRGLIFETEADTLSHSFKSHLSDFSDGLRKVSQHEMISLFRKTNHEHFEIRHPCIAGVFSGTPHQVLALIPSAVNTLDQHPAIEFSLTPEQDEQFNDFFDKLSEKYIALQGIEYLAIVRRLGLIAFRMAMILTTLRIMELGNFNQEQECQDSDFQRVLSMIRVLVRHSSHVFSQLPAINHSAKLKDKKEQFLDRLPEKFNRMNFINLAKSLSIAERTAEKYISIFCEKSLIYREMQGNYVKPLDG